MVKTVSVRLDVKYDTTAGELAEQLSAVPAEAQIKVTQTKYHDPRDSGETYITATWKEVS